MIHAETVKKFYIYLYIFVYSYILYTQFYKCVIDLCGLRDDCKCGWNVFECEIENLYFPRSCQHKVGTRHVRFL